MKTAGINGFGRFGLGVLTFWLNSDDSPYNISFLNDPLLGIEEIIAIIKNEVDFKIQAQWLPSSQINILSLKKINGNTVSIEVSTGKMSESSWLGKPDLLLECTGTISESELKKLITRNTKLIFVSGISTSADSILVYGFNHFEFNQSLNKIISFGSCTVIPGVHLLSLIHYRYKIMDCSINIIHSIPKWQIDKNMNQSLKRKHCSLEIIAPQLINDFDNDILKVNYTFAPFYGPSMIDFQITVYQPAYLPEFLEFLTYQITNGKLNGIASLNKHDLGAVPFINSVNSVDLIQDSFVVRKNRIYFFGYFNNEGSGIRLHELVSYICLNISS